jgi:hypothetical protein
MGLLDFARDRVPDLAEAGVDPRGRLAEPLWPDPAQARIGRDDAWHCSEPSYGVGTVAWQTRDVMGGTLECMARTSATPWGAAAVVDELVVPQRAGDKRFSSVVQLLEVGGERLVRFSYATAGIARRGPVTLRARDLERLRAELAKHPDLAEALSFGGAPVRSRPKGSTGNGGA